tara:strand:- start:245 stop:406 length:162 start_codon:yes stop_codon:yes gene_type:complete
MSRKLDKVFWIVATIIAVIIGGWLAYRGGEAVGESSTRTSSTILPVFVSEVLK